MSLKRAKQHSRGTRDDIEDAPRRARATTPEKSWSEHMAGQAEGAFVVYALSGHFTQGALISHSTFGRGVVLGALDRRIDVLFEAGRKTLTHAG